MPARIRAAAETLPRKDPQRRLHDIADARIEIDEALAHPSGETTAAGGTAARRMSGQEIAAWTIATVSIVALLAFVLTARRTSTEATDAQTYRSSIVLAENLRLTRVDGSPAGAFALSPDGRRLAFIANEPNGKPQLWVRPLDGSGAQLVAGTEGAAAPFWSADSRLIGYLLQPTGRAFTVERELMRVDLDGSQPIKLTDAHSNSSGTWNRDGAILFTPSGSAPIYRVAATGGPATAATRLDQASGDVQHTAPWFLPDGRHFLYSAIGNRSGAPAVRGVYLGSLDPAEPPRLLLPGALVAQYASGYLVFMRGATLFAQPFDPGTLQLSGASAASPERELVPAAGGGVRGAFSVSANGVLVYQPASALPSQLIWFDRAGNQLGNLGEPADYAEVDLAPDGARAAVSVLDPQVGTRDLWISTSHAAFASASRTIPGKTSRRCGLRRGIGSSSRARAETASASSSSRPAAADKRRCSRRPGWPPENSPRSGRPTESTCSSSPAAGTSPAATSGSGHSTSRTRRSRSPSSRTSRRRRASRRTAIGSRMRRTKLGRSRFTCRRSLGREGSIASPRMAASGRAGAATATSSSSSPATAH